MSTSTSSNSGETETETHLSFKNCCNHMLYIRIPAPMEAHYLQPFGPGSIGLRIVRIDPQIEGAPETKVVVLGRNILTGLDSSNDKYSVSVSRNHAEISIVDAKIFVTATARQENIVFRNRSSIPRNVATAIVPGDEISLLGQIQYFNYTLVRGTMTDDMIEACYVASCALQQKTSQKRKLMEMAPRIDNEANSVGLDSSTLSDNLNTATQPADAVEPNVCSSSSSCGIGSRASAKLEEHYMCSICCAAMACCHSLSPCGDVFCYPCIADWSKQSKSCPLCSGDFVLKSAVPNRTLDGIIREILTLDTDPNVLDEWEDRVLQGIHRKTGVKHVAVRRILKVVPPIVARSAVPVIHASAAVTSRNALPSTVIPIAGGGLIDLTFDDPVRDIPPAPARSETVRSVEVSYGVGSTKYKCQCGGVVKPKHVRVTVSVDDTSLGSRQLFYHMWCISGAEFRAHKILLTSFGGLENLKPVDLDQLKLRFDLVE